MTALFQPIVDQDGDLLGYEQLGRGAWTSLPESPLDLFAIAEHLDLESELSRTLRLEGLREAALLPGAPVIFVNTHPREITRLDQLIETLREAGKVKRRGDLVLDIHEMAVGPVNEFRPFREALTDLGMYLAFDDFDAGRARFLELAELTPHFVKFDRQLIQGLDRASPHRLDLIRGLIRTVADLGIKTVAEGVETANEAEICNALVFHYSQGYFFGKPAAVSTYVTSRENSRR